MAWAPLRAGQLTALITLDSPYDGIVSMALDPSGGTLSGSPGDVVGWGFTLTTDAYHGILIDGSDFCTSGPPYPSPCTNTYTDLIGFTNGIFVNAGDAPLHQDFDPANSLGFGSLVVPPLSVSGQLLLFYTITDSSGNPLTPQLTASTTADVNVSGASVPEPSGWMLAAVAFSILAALRYPTRSGCENRKWSK